jgi:hypothetical protein
MGAMGDFTNRGLPRALYRVQMCERRQKLGLFRFPRSAGESVPSRTSVFRQAVAGEGGTPARGFFMPPALAAG